jgi:hypothetical protein
MYRTKKNTGISQCFSVFVAGPGIEPGSGGYEPPEVPLLYPAVIVELEYHWI